MPESLILNDFKWAFRIVFDDWRKHRPKRVRDTLPSGFTSPRLRYIRKVACMRAALQESRIIECTQWTQSDLSGNKIEEGQVPFPATAEYACNTCKHPCVTHADLTRELGLTVEKESFCERTWRRYLNAKQPMPVDLFRRVIANAFALDWLSAHQALAIWKEIDELMVVRKSMVAFSQRAGERKDFGLSKNIDASKRDIDNELFKQIRLLDHECIHVLHQRSMDQRLTVENRSRFKNMIFRMR